MTTIEFKKIRDSEEFLRIFDGICNIAESAFSDFEQEIERNDISHPRFFGQRQKSLLRLLGIVLVITGMRGEYPPFQESFVSIPLAVQKDGVEYGQAHLYKMNDHFVSRFTKLLSLVKDSDPELYQFYKDLWVRAG